MNKLEKIYYLSGALANLGRYCEHVQTHLSNEGNTPADFGGSKREYEYTLEAIARIREVLTNKLREIDDEIPGFQIDDDD